MEAEALRIRDGEGWALRGALLGLAALTLAACAGGPRPLDAGAGGAPTSRYAGYKVGKPYQVKGVWYYPQEQPQYDEIGIASWYGEQFHNHYTADGEVFDMGLPSAAHKTLPLPSLVEVTNLANGRTVIVRVNDRGPFVDGRVIDMSKAAATELGFVAAGVTRVRVRYVGKADAPPEPRQYQASNPPQPSPPKPALKLSPPNIQLAQGPSILAPPPLAAPVVTPPAMTPPIPAPSAQTVAVADAAPPPALARAAEEPISQAALAPSVAQSAPSYVASAASAAPVDDVSALLSGSAPAIQAAAPAGAGYVLQAGVFASRANAEALAARLGDVGLPEVTPFQHGGQTLYRVAVHGFSNQAAAAAARSQAAALGASDARVIAGS